MEEVKVTEAPNTEEPKVSIEELMFKKLLQIKENRASILSDEDKARGVRLLRSPYDDLYFEDFDSFKEELEKIKSKTSKLSATKRSAINQLQFYVIYDMTSAVQKGDSPKEEEAVEVNTEPEAHEGE